MYLALCGMHVFGVRRGAQCDEKSASNVKMDYEGAYTVEAAASIGKEKHLEHEENTTHNSSKNTTHTSSDCNQDISEWYLGEP